MEFFQLYCFDSINGGHTILSVTESALTLQHLKIVYFRYTAVTKTAHFKTLRVVQQYALKREKSIAVDIAHPFMIIKF